MSSANIRSVAADSNVLLSALAGKAARRVFEQPELIVVTTEHNVEEIREYIPYFAARYGLPEELLLETLYFCRSRSTPSTNTRPNSTPPGACWPAVIRTTWHSPHSH